MTIVKRANHADVALLLEGTYPYVAGGVSSWVHTIIKGFPHLRFALVFIGSTPSDYGPARYTLPDNVVHLETHYLFEPEPSTERRPLTVDASGMQAVRRLHAHLHGESDTDPGAPALRDQVFGDVVDRLDSSLSAAHFQRGAQTWEFIAEQYRERCTDPSFVDYFWTVRTMHAPIWKLQRIAAGLLPVRVLHTVSTGYAGLLGALCARRQQRPLVLSEHGIYTKERRIDLFAARWIADKRSVLQRERTELSYFRELWIRFFEGLGRTCYDAAGQIIALYETNRLRQVADGADPARTRNIANGIDVPTFAALRKLRPLTPPRVLCLIGRVVPIKDVKTFIRAVHALVPHLPDAQGWIAGPMEEDPSYAAECQALVSELGLQDHVRFLGFQKLTDVLPKIGLVVLSSISEALPLVLLEGYAAGVPAVSTDVGSCRQLIEGLPGEDAQMGASGRVVGIADPQALAQAARQLLGDTAAWNAAAQAGIQRVERFYSLPLMLDAYADVYAKALAHGSPAKVEA